MSNKVEAARGGPKPTLEELLLQVTHLQRHNQIMLPVVNAAQEVLIAHHRNKRNSFSTETASALGEKLYRHIQVTEQYLKDYRKLL